MSERPLPTTDWDQRVHDFLERAREVFGLDAPSGLGHTPAAEKPLPQAEKSEAQRGGHNGS